ncbi:hypothetical protein BKI52_44285 [marine bacterium AO1-C]|nr:hypothetical protein BKI52_44285 [marine bacterium AO1-C]
MNATFSKILSYSIIGVVIIFTVIGLFSGMPSTDAEEFEPNMLFYVLYGLGALAIAGVVFGFVLNAITNPKSLIVPVGSALGLVVLWWITKITASNETYTKPLPEIGASLSQSIGGVLTMTYVLMFMAFLAIIVAWAIKAFR